MNDKKNTGFARLEQNLIDVIKESQIKLGYDYGALQFFYPLATLNHLLNVQLTEAEMLVYLEEFAQYVKNRLGEVRCTGKKERFAFAVLADGMKYVHEHVETSAFLEDLIRMTAFHGCSMEDVLQVFRKYSEHVIQKEIEDDEFDCVIYFEDGKPDDYLYCFRQEGSHIIYHRFTKEDYGDLGVK